MMHNSQVKEVTTYVTIETNVYQNITIPIRAQIRKPTLTDTAVTNSHQHQQQDQGEEQQQSSTHGGVQVEVIDFDYVQVGTSQTRNLKVINPTDEPFFFTLLLTSNENYQRITDKSSNQQKQKGPSVQDKDFYFQLFCLPKLELSIDSFKLRDLTLNGRENPIVACQKIHQILNSIEHLPANDESVLTLRRRLEAYLKDMFTMEVQLDQQLAMERHQKHAERQSSSFHFENPEIQELHNISNLINQQSRARPIDQETLNIFRITYEKQQKIFAEIEQKKGVGSSFFSQLPDFQTIVSTSWNVLQQIILSRQNQLNQKP